MKQKLVVFSIVIALLTIGALVVSAQGGNGGNGNGGNGSGGQTPGDCIPDGTGANSGVNSSTTCTGTQPLDGTGQQRGQRSRGGQGAGNQGTGAQGSGQSGSGWLAALPPASTDTLPQNVIDLMIEGWLDEQHAYAVYGAVIDQFGAVRPFVNIQQSEAQHIAAWEYLFERYGIAVPAVPAFDIPAFASVTDACALGAQAEVANFGLYDQMLVTFEDYPDIYQVALTLRNASEFSHLPAFQSCAG